MTLPNFFIIGAYKSGTTSLYHYLREHPEIFMSPIKEPNFFAHQKIAEILIKKGRGPNVIDNISTYAELFSEVTHQKAIGEASPLYLSSPFAAQRIKDTIPDAKLIAILRNPAEAFYSNHQMHVRLGNRTIDEFKNKLSEVKKRIRSGKTVGLMYYEQLKVYYNLFEPSKIRIYLFEDLIQNSKGLIGDILRFLEVDDNFLPNISKKYNVGGTPSFFKLNKFLIWILMTRMMNIKMTSLLRSGVLNLQKLNVSKTPPLSSELKIELIDLLREDIVNLERIIERDLSNWLN